MSKHGTRRWDSVAVVGAHEPIKSIQGRFVISRRQRGQPFVFKHPQTVALHPLSLSLSLFLKATFHHLNLGSDGWSFRKCRQTTCFSAPHWLNIEPSIWETVIVYPRFVVVWLRVITKVRFDMFMQVLFGKMNRWVCSSKYGVATQKVETLLFLFLLCLFKKTSSSVKQDIHMFYLFYMIPEGDKNYNNKEIHSCLSRLWREVPWNCFPYPYILLFLRIWKWAVACLSVFFFLCTVIHNM